MTTTDSSVPVPVVDAAGVELTNATRIATGDNHACAIVNVMSRDRVFCWGDNSSRQVAASAGASSAVAVEQTGITAAAQRIATGNGFSCALLGGVVQCWGLNSAGQCGRGSVGGTCDTPTFVNDVGGARITGVTDIVAGRSHACAFSMGAGIQCWGDNGNGQLGDGTTMTRPSAAPAMNTRAALSVHAGANHTCAFADGELYCWGANASGQLFVLPAGGNRLMPELATAMPIDVLHIWTGYFTSCVWETMGLRCAGTLRP
jgi:alpha-tubulin suppressor-like RCC1 family protein